MDVNETRTITYTYTVKEEDLGKMVSNTATVTSSVPEDPKEPEVDPPTDEDTTETPTVDQVKDYTVKKEASESTNDSGKFRVGDVIDYTITVTNTGNQTLDITLRDTLTAAGTIVIVDVDGASYSTDETGKITTFALVDVKPDETVTIKYQYTVLEGDVGNTISNAIVGSDPEDPNKPGPETETETDVENPKLDVSKEVTAITAADGTEKGTDATASLGDVITYKVTVTNTGNVDLENVTIDDSLIKSEAGVNVIEGSFKIGTLKVTEDKYVIYTYEVQESDLGKTVVNTATAEGNVSDDPENPTKDTDTEETPTDNRNPHLTVKKETTSEPANGTAYVLGEVIKYTVTVTNDGNVTIENVVAVDELEGAVLQEGTTNKPVLLKPGESKTAYFEYEVQESDLGKIVANTATATGDIVPNPDPDPENPDPEEPPVTPGTEEDPTDDRSPKLSVEKEVTSTPAAEDGKYVLGETITYKVTVTNVGNLTLNDIVISDVLTRPDGTTTVPSGFDVNDARIDSLAPGESAEITYSHVVTEADLGGALTNAATADGQPNIPDPDPTTPDPDPTPDEPGTSTVDTEDPSNCSITVTKQTTDYMGEAIVLNEDASFHVALFSDEAMTQQVGEVQTIAYAGNSSTASVTFDNLKRGTYYVAEVDENGNVISDSGSFDGGVYVPQYADGNQVVITDNGTAATFAFTNAFLVLPSGGDYYWEKNLTITKNVRDVDGDEMNVNETFYAGIFTDESLTTLADNVSQNIVPLRLNGTSSVSVDVGVTVPTDGSEITLYVAEVTSAGVPVENTDGFAYTVEVENGAVTLAEESEDAAVVITNTSTEETQESECETTAEKNDGSSNTTGSSTKSVKTGDETPIMMLVCMLGISAMAIILLVFRRRRSQA